MSDLSAETKIAPIQSTKMWDIFSSLCSRLLGDIENERILRERTLIDFCKTATWIISDGVEALPESFYALADRVSAYWLYETDDDTDEERKYSYIRLFQTVCVLRVFLSERELEDKAFSAVEQNYANKKMICLIGQEPGISSQSIMDACAFSQDELSWRTDILCQDGFLSTRRSQSEQYYFLTNAGETLGQFLEGPHQRQRHFLQPYWSHDRTTVLTVLLQQLNSSNLSLDIRKVIKMIDSLNEKAIKVLLISLTQYDRNTYTLSTINMIQNGDIPPGRGLCDPIPGQASGIREYPAEPLSIDRFMGQNNLILGKSE